ANVAISYRRPGDALARATVIKFFGAEVHANQQRDASRTESVVRFDGGVPIWELKADESTFARITDDGTPDQPPEDSGAPPEEAGAAPPVDPNAPAVDPNAPPSLP